MRWVDFKEIKERVSIREVLLSYYRIEGLREMNDKLIGPCPVHGGDSPTAFHADLERNIWHCFTGCKGGGNVLDLVAKKEGISVREAALKLQELFLSSDGGKGATRAATASACAGEAKEVPSVDPVGATVPGKRGAGDQAKSSGSATPANPPLTFVLNLAPDHPYLLKTRSLTPTTIEHFGLGYCSKGTVAGRIAIPIHNEKGELVAYAGRSIKTETTPERPKYKFPKGFKKQLVLYNLHRICGDERGGEELILVEGFFDVFRLYEAGYENVVALMGTSMSIEQEALLRRSCSKVTLFFDGDTAGRNCAEECLWRLVHDLHVRLIELEDGEEPDGLDTDRIKQLLG